LQVLVLIVIGAYYKDKAIIGTELVTPPLCLEVSPEFLPDFSRLLNTFFGLNPVLMTISIRNYYVIYASWSFYPNSDYSLASRAHLHIA